jgi:signal transduction histidine kinase
VAHTPYGVGQREDYLTGREELAFRPVEPPESADRGGHYIWLRARLDPGDLPRSASVLEVPGHLLSNAVIHYRWEDGENRRYTAGSRGAPEHRVFNHGGIAFPLPPPESGPVEMTILMASNLPLNFTALAWDGQSWSRHLSSQRLWYGLFFGGMLMLAVYNLFFAAVVRDRSYLYYVGYVLALGTAVFLYSPLPEQYLPPELTPVRLVLTVAGVAVFFSIGFVNSFLRVPQRWPRAWKLSRIIAWFALVLGVSLGFRWHVFPVVWSSNLMHGALIAGALYFLGISVLSYFRGIREARFLALSIVPMIAGLVGFVLYTYAFVPYSPEVFHAIEAGSLLEGLLLSMALADRVNVMRQDKERAEDEALDAQRHFSRRLLQSQEADRERFAGTLHDSIGHGLLVIRQNLQAVLASDDRGLQGGHRLGPSGLEATLGQVDEMLQEVRGLSHDMHPHLLRRLGLKAALESTVERAFTPLRMEAFADIDDLPEDLDPELEMTVYRIVQECLNNVLRHAEAKEVLLRVECRDGVLEVQVKDDGRGFDPTGAGAMTAPGDGQGLGLLGIRERLALFGGWLSIESAPGRGTHVRFGVPAG